jgi:thiol-disulfide isomerase/thioredoxin
MQMTEKGDQNFEFTLAPKMGNRAADVTLVDAETGKLMSLRSLLGKIVYLEFWATWCGPCKTPMAKLNTVTRNRRSDWADRVEVIAVSIDDSEDVVYRYIETRGWTNVRHYRTGERDRIRFKSPAADKFGIQGVPSAILVDPEGVTVWR